MQKSARLLLYSTGQMLGIFGGFIGVSIVLAWLLGGTDNLFGNYLIACTMMAMIFSGLLGTNAAGSLVNVGLALGATRRGMWGAMQLNLLVMAAGSLAIQCCTDWFLSRYPQAVSLNLSITGATLPLYLAALLFLFNAGALGGMVESKPAKAAVGLCWVLGFAAVTGFGLVRSLGWMDRATEALALAAATGVCAVGAAVCMVLLHRQVKRVQVRAIRG